MSGNASEMLSVRFLTDDDALEMIQSIDLVPPRLSKCGVRAPRALQPSPSSSAPRQSRHDPARRRRRMAQRAAAVALPASSPASSDSGSDSDEHAPVSTAVRRELASAQLEADAGDAAVGGRSVFSFQRAPRGRYRKQRTKQRGRAGKTGDHDAAVDGGEAEEAAVSVAEVSRKRCRSADSPPAEGVDDVKSARKQSPASCVTPKRRKINVESLQTERGGTKAMENGTPSLGSRHKESSSARNSSDVATPKRRSRNAAGGGDSCSVRPSPLRTPRSVRRGDGVRGAASPQQQLFETPERRSSSTAGRAQTEQTPYTLRRRVKLRLSKLSQDDLAVSDDDDSDLSDFVPSDEEPEDDVEDQQPADEDGSSSDGDAAAPSTPPAAAPSTPPAAAPSTSPAAAPAPRRTAVSAGPSAADTLPDEVQDYFVLQSAAGVTSDRTLNRLSRPRLSESALRSGLQQLGDQRHAVEQRALLQDTEALFDRWLLLLTQGFNVVLHGLGSKRPVLERFRVTRLAHQLHVVINGFFPNLTPRHLLQSLVTDVLAEDSYRNAGLQAQTELVCRRFGAGARHRLFLLVPSIDGAAVRGEKMQQLLCQLAAVENVHVLASVDHVNAPIIWNQNMLASFNFIWFDASTFSPYTEETSYENSLLVQSGGALALSSLRHVFQSLTQNARGVFILLAKEQVSRADDRSYDGMPLSALYRRCRESFLVSSQMALKAQLTEFRDHKLLVTRKAADGADHLTVPLQPHLITEFISGCQDVN